MRRLKLIGSILICACIVTSCQKKESISVQNLDTKIATEYVKPKESDQIERKKFKTGIFAVSYDNRQKIYTDISKQDFLLEHMFKYPKIESKAHKKAEDQINHDMEEIVKKEEEKTPILAKDRKIVSISNTNILPDSKRYKLYSFLEAMRNDTNILSFFGDNDSFNEENRILHNPVAYNYNANTGQRLSFDDLSKEPTAFKQRICNYIKSLCDMKPYKNNTQEEISDKITEDMLSKNNWFLSKAGLIIALMSEKESLQEEETIRFVIPYETLNSFGMDQRYQYYGTYMALGMESQTLNHDLNGNKSVDSVVYTISDKKEKMTLTVDNKDFSDQVERVLTKTDQFEKYYYLYDLKQKDHTVTAIAIPTIGKSKMEKIYFFKYTKEGTLNYLGYTKEDILTSEVATELDLKSLCN